MNENVGTGSIDAGTITDADTVGTYGCMVLMQQTLLVQFLETVDACFRADPNYESPADADTNCIYVTVRLMMVHADDANGATTLTITVADVNDITPTYKLHQLHRQLPKVQLQWILTLPLLTQIQLKYL